MAPVPGDVVAGATLRQQLSGYSWLGQDIDGPVLVRLDTDPPTIEPAAGYDLISQTTFSDAMATSAVIGIATALLELHATGRGHGGVRAANVVVGVRGTVVFLPPTPVAGGDAPVPTEDVRRLAELLFPSHPARAALGASGQPGAPADAREALEMLGPDTGRAALAAAAAGIRNASEARRRWVSASPITGPAPPPPPPGYAPPPPPAPAPMPAPAAPMAAPTLHPAPTIGPPLASAAPSTRRAAVRWYARMLVGRNHSLQVEVTGSDTSLTAHRGTTVRVGGRAFAIGDDPFVEIEPRFPGCLVVPAVARIDSSGPPTTVTFHVTPLVAGDLSTAGVVVRSAGQVADVLATPCIVRSRVLVRVFALFAGAAPFLGLEVETQQRLSGGLRMLGSNPFATSIAVTGAFLLAAGAAMLRSEPKEAEGSPVAT